MCSEVGAALEVAKVGGVRRATSDTSSPAAVSKTQSVIPEAATTEAREGVQQHGSRSRVERSYLECRNKRAGDDDQIRRPVSLEDLTGR